MTITVTCLYTALHSSLLSINDDNIIGLAPSKINKNVTAKPRNYLSRMPALSHIVTFSIKIAAVYHNNRRLETVRWTATDSSVLMLAGRQIARLIQIC